MRFSNENLREELKHNRPIVSLNRFVNNDIDHYYSISDNSEIREWTINSFGYFGEEIDVSHLYRPNEEFLTKEGHLPTRKPKSHKYFKITYSISFKHFLVNGYEDGLILVWRQEKRDMVDKKRLKQYNSFTESSLGEVLEIVNDGIELKYAPARLQDDAFTLKHDETTILNQSLDTYLKAPEKPQRKAYYNIMWLHFILIGNTQAIIYLLYLPDKDYLMSSSEDLTIKFYQMSSGKQLYTIDLQTEAKFLIYIDKPKQEKLVLLTSPNNKVEVKMNEDTLAINTSVVPSFVGIRKVLCFNKKFYLIQYNTLMLIYGTDFRLEKEIKYPSYENFIDMMLYGDYFIFFSADRRLHVCQLNEDKLNKLFSIEIGKSTVSNSMIVDHILYMTNLDGWIYSINIKAELELYWNRKNMIEEEKLSVAFNKLVMSKRGRGKGAKGKGGKGKSVTKEAKVLAKPKAPAKSPRKKKEVKK